jgi:hypothetical protein
MTNEQIMYILSLPKDIAILLLLTELRFYMAPGTCVAHK